MQPVVTSSSTRAGRWFLPGHALGGLLLGLLVLYPLSTVAFWFEFSGHRLPVGKALVMIYAGLLLDFDPVLPLLAAGGGMLGTLLGLLVGWHRRASRRSLARREEIARHVECFVLTLISLGENRRTVFRPALRWNHAQQRLDLALEEEARWALRALYHQGGGLLLLGVDKEGNVAGLEADYATLWDHSLDAFRQHLMLVTLGTTTPALRDEVHLWFVSVGGKDICMILVGNGLADGLQDARSPTALHASRVLPAPFAPASLDDLIRHLSLN